MESQNVATRLIVCGLVLALACQALGDTFLWQGAGTGGVTATDPTDPATHWSNPDNWVGSGTSAKLYFENAGRCNLDVANVQLDSLIVDGVTEQADLHIPSGLDLSASSVVVGETGIGCVVHTGGTHHVGELRIAEDTGSHGTYTFRDGLLTTSSTAVGVSGTGLFLQEGGNHAAGRLTVNGTYEHEGGNHTNGGLTVNGTYEQEGGNHTTDGFTLNGTYKLTSGDLSARYGGVYTGASFLQEGGNHTTDGLTVNGTYKLTAGDLSVTYNENVGASFLQEGGNHTANRLYVSGTYDLRGGTIDVKYLHLNGGTLTTGSGAPSPLSFDSLYLDGGRLAEGLRVDIRAPGKWEGVRIMGTCCTQGLESLTVTFSEGEAWLEAAGQIGGGFDDNFSMGSLQVGGTNPVTVSIIDTCDNGNRVEFTPGYPGAPVIYYCESVHVKDLVIDALSSVDLDFSMLYIEGDAEALLDTYISDGRLFSDKQLDLDARYDAANGWTVVGEPYPFPEPATLALLALGGVGALLQGRRHGRR